MKMFHRLGAWACSLLTAASLLGCATPAKSWPYLPGHRGASGGSGAALSLIVSPSTQVVSISGPGTASAQFSLLPSGGLPPYTYSTTSGTLTVTNATAATPTVSHVLTGGQDTTYLATGTVTDSSGATATAGASVEMKAAAVIPGLSLAMAPSSQLKTQNGSGVMSASVTYTASGGVPPYTYSTAAPGLSITNGTTTTPTVSATILAGQDTTFNLTGTLHDSAGTAPATAAGTVEFHAIPLPLSLTAAPASQVQTRSGPGAIAATVNYTASGGVPPYTYSTSAPGLTVTNGTTVSPSVSTTLTDLQDSTFAVTGTLNDSAGSTPATDTASVHFTATAAGGFDPLVPLARGMVADNIAETQFQWTNGGSHSIPAYKLSPKVLYGQTDMTNLGVNGAGFTYFRIPIDVQDILPGLPFPFSFLQVDKTVGSPTLGQYYPLAPSLTQSNLPSPGSTAGCGSLYFSNDCTVQLAFSYLDPIIDLMVSNGFAVDLVPFAAGNYPGDAGAGCVDKTQTCPSAPSNSEYSDLHWDMGSGTHCYGFTVMPGATCFETMLQAANMVLVNHYKDKYPQAGQVFFELYNEPDYNTTNDTFAQPAAYSLAIANITAAIRAVDTTHWLIVDCVGVGAKAEHCGWTTPTSDTKTVYSFHKYDPSSFVTMGSSTPVNPYDVYPVPSSGEPAIGRPGGVAPAYMAFPAPVYGTPTGYKVTATQGCADSVPLPKDKSGNVITPTTAWAANATTPVTPDSQQVCVTTSGGQTTSLVDMYSGDGTYSGTGDSGSDEIVKADLLNDPKNGIQLAVKWASANGHGTGISGATWANTAGGQTTYTVLTDMTGLINPGDSVVVSGVGVNSGVGYNGTWTVVSVAPTTIVVTQVAGSSPGTFNTGKSIGILSGGPLSSSVLKIIIGEIGVTRSVDYLSADQFLMDLRATLDSTSVPGGQSSIPWDFWAFSGTQHGFRPKSTTGARTHWCPYTTGALTGYDKDWVGILSTPQTFTTPQCLGQAGYTTPGY